MKIERTAPLSRPDPLLLLYGPGLSRHRSRPPPPHGLRRRRSRPAKTRTSGSEFAIPNPTSDLLVAPRNVQQGETPLLSRFFSQADGHTQPSFLVFGLHRRQLLSTRLVRDLDKHANTTASMAQYNSFIEWPKCSSPQGCLHWL